MAIKYNGQDLLKRYFNGQEVQKVMYNWQQIRPDVVPPTVDYLCFTGTAGSSIALAKVWSPYAVNLEISYDKTTWSDYTFWVQINYDNNINKVYFRNKSTTPTYFSTTVNNYYQFFMSGSIAWSGDITTLLCKTGTTTLTSDCCFFRLFYGCSVLTTPPSLPATTLTERCYWWMFRDCSALTIAPELPALTVPDRAYEYMFVLCTSLTTPPDLPATTFVWTYNCYDMFNWCSNLESLPLINVTTLTDNCFVWMFMHCSKIKLSITQTGDYQIPYMIPQNWWWTSGYHSLEEMFSSTWWTFTWTPFINTTYYTSNTVI